MSKSSPQLLSPLNSLSLSTNDLLQVQTQEFPTIPILHATAYHIHEFSRLYFGPKVIFPTITAPPNMLVQKQNKGRDEIYHPPYTISRAPFYAIIYVPNIIFNDHPLPNHPCHQTLFSFITNNQLTCPDPPFPVSHSYHMPFHIFSETRSPLPLSCQHIPHFTFTLTSNLPTPSSSLYTNMSTLHYFFLNNQTLEWECHSSCQVTPRGLCCNGKCNEVLIVNYMGLDWITPEDVLGYLFDNASARCLLQHVANIARSTEADPILIIHLLLNPPIHLKGNDDDIKFLETIQNWLAKERGDVDNLALVHCVL